MSVYPSSFIDSSTAPPPPLAEDMVVVADHPIQSFKKHLGDLAALLQAHLKDAQKMLNEKPSAMSNEISGHHLFKKALHVEELLNIITTEALEIEALNFISLDQQMDFREFLRQKQLKLLQSTIATIYPKLNQQIQTKTLPLLQGMKNKGNKIAMLTCYDSSMARICEQAWIDILLVGDSLGNVIKGQSSTLGVSMNDMIYHTKAVCSGAPNTFIIADMPFGAYPNPEKAYQAAAELMAAGAHMVKLEGTGFLPPIVEYLSVRGIPTCGHIGLIPQFVHKLGGMRMQGKSEKDAQVLKKLARDLMQAGADMLLFEAIPAALGAEITEMTKSYDIPTIGIGAGSACDGQVLVMHDVLGISKHIPKFAKNYLAELLVSISQLEQKLKHFQGNNIEIDSFYAPLIGQDLFCELNASLSATFSDAFELLRSLQHHAILSTFEFYIWHVKNKGKTT